MEKAPQKETFGKHQKPGRLFIISAPSGAGKSTLCHDLLNRYPDLLYSISYTTRAPRDTEQNGVDYHFISKNEFQEGITQQRWAEWAHVHGHYYGTSAQFLTAKLSAGRDILLEIDVQGARQIFKKYPEGISIFIMPPSLAVLQHRLEKRSTDKPEVIALRLENAKKEMAQKDLYRYVVVNDKLPDAVQELIEIIEKWRS